MSVRAAFVIAAQEQRHAPVNTQVVRWPMLKLINWLRPLKPL
jgi:hypothetical protein